MKLTKSLEIKSKKELNLKAIFGAWEDDRSPEEIINDIRTSGVEKDDSYSFE